MAEQPKNLAEALLIFQADPPVLVKDKAGHQSKYADLVQVNDKVLSRLNALGVTFTSAPTMLDDGKFVLEYKLKHVASGDTEGGRYPLKLAENPQAMGSAITYARRYVLQALTNVAAEGEDDDGQAASGRATVQRASMSRPRKSTPAPAPADEGQQTAQRAQRSARPPAGAPPLPGEQSAGATPGGGISTSQRGMLMGQFTKLDLTDRTARLRTLSTLVGRTLESSSELSRAEASEVINLLADALKADDPRAVVLEALAAAAGAGEGR
jgi:hypothetical protein